jgi:predicted metal-dependent phosphotriesterase family hydrolase
VDSLSFVPHVRTVLGDIDPGELGATYCHEHLITSPAAPFLSDGPDMLLNDVEKAARELDVFRSAGGRGLVEVSTPEFGRSVDALRRLSSSSGVNIVCCTGHVSEEYWRGVLPVERSSVEELEEEFLRDLTEGFGDEGAKAGVIKVGTSLEGATRAEERVIRAAASVQMRSGAPITTHTTDGTAGMDQIRILLDSGAHPSGICVGHLDRRLRRPAHLDIARTGVFLGYDCISKEKYEPDARRVEFILWLVEEGHSEQILLSADMARRSYLEAWGGSPGYRYIIETFVPSLIDAGLDDESARALLVDNPARFLTWSEV